jgi:hypothetical protein
MDFTKIHKIKGKLDNCDVSGFRNAEESFVRFVESIEVENFRRLKNLKVRTHNQNMTVAAMQMADRNRSAHLS